MAFRPEVLSFHSYRSQVFDLVMLFMASRLLDMTDVPKELVCLATAPCAHPGLREKWGEVAEDVGVTRGVVTMTSPMQLVATVGGRAGNPVKRNWTRSRQAAGGESREKMQPKRPTDVIGPAEAQIRVWNGNSIPHVPHD
jgi:hypothetical protein